MYICFPEKRLEAHNTVDKMHHYCTKLTIFLTLLFSIINTSVLSGQDKILTTNNQQWLQYYNQIKLNDKWTWFSDGGYRWKDGFKTSSQYIARTAAGYALNPDIQVTLGFAHLGFYSSGNVDKIEFRPYQELVVKNKFNKIGLNHRYRIEERFLNPVANGGIQASNTFNFRFRYAVMMSVPLFRLSKKNPDRIILLAIGNEIFINAGKDINHNIFDQNRLILSPGIQLNELLTISLTWNSLYASTATQTNYMYSNVIWLQITHKIRLKKKNE